MTTPEKSTGKEVRSEGPASKGIRKVNNPAGTGHAAYQKPKITPINNPASGGKDNSPACMYCTACETCEACLVCLTCEVCDGYCDACDGCEACMGCEVCDGVCDTCDICDGCEVCVTCETCDGFCDTCDICDGCEVCVTCETCDGFCDTCDACDGCEACMGCEVCDGVCDTCDICDGCEVCVTCETCDGFCDGCDSCDACLDCNACDACDACVECETCVGGDASLAVTLTAFNSARARAGIQLSWRTESETNNLGFFLFRSLSENGPFEPVNAEIISGAGSASSAHEYEYVDRNVDAKTTYWYLLETVDVNGDTTTMGPIECRPSSGQGHFSPEGFRLSTNYPNPFNGRTTLTLTVPENGRIEADIVDATGRSVRTLMSGPVESGTHPLAWDSRNNRGDLVPSGTYICRVRYTNGETFTVTQKMSYIR
jgi:hypothetical protein